MVRCPLAILATLFALSAPARAQTVAGDTTSPRPRVDAPASVSVLPALAVTPALTRTTLTAAITRPMSARPTLALGLASPPQATRRSDAMMLVGAAGLVAGAVIGGDAGTIIMVGGAGLGLYGLWNRLK